MNTKELKSQAYDLAIIFCLIAGAILIVYGFFLGSEGTSLINLGNIGSIAYPPLVASGIGLIGLGFKFGKEQ